MITVADIYQGAERLINQILRQEVIDQGHHLSGALESSFESDYKREGKSDIMQGFAVYYTQFVNDGVPAESASMRQFPFVKRYFMQRGLDEKSAGAAAAATIRTWQKQGMSTLASRRFSKTGARQQMIESAFTGAASKIDEYMSNSFDFGIEQKFQQEKSETI